MKVHFTNRSLTVILITFLTCSSIWAQNLALNRPVTVSSTRDGYAAEYAVDGVVSDPSRWLNNAEANPTIDVALENEVRLGGVHIYTGYNLGSPIRDFTVQYNSGGQWLDIPSAVITGNTRVAISITFDDTVEIVTNAIRLSITDTPSNIARIREITIWGYSSDGIPELGTGVTGYVPVLTDDDVPRIYINQSGYSINKPKRFTAPTLDDDTQFIIVDKEVPNTALYTGVITNNIGDFSGFNPSNPDIEYVIIAGDITSFPFGIGHWWTERVTYQGAIDFMVDARHYVGNYTRNAPQSYGWRDDTHFGWELHTLVPQYLSHPEAYNRMPSQISYVAASGSRSSYWGDLDVYDASAPDIVKLIHWGADIIVSRGLTHENVKAQLAFFLHAWPYLKEWLPQQNYNIVRDFAFNNWRNTTADRYYSHDETGETLHNLLDLKTIVGTTKGGLPPGRTVLPNLLMYEVALEEGRSDAEDYFNAAYNQVQWMINNLDWEDPLNTKGQRMSEFHTMTGLVHFALEYPDRAPSGLVNKIESWADVMIRRSDNMWDFRKLTDNAEWIPFDETAATKWNEPGNVVGFPACLLAATKVIKDKEINDRLLELAYSHMDNCFGRNPVGRHFSYDGAREIEGVEIGWYSFYQGGIGQLANTRFVLDGAPKYNHYPFNPEIGNVGWTEGWVTFNVAYNLSLAYMANNDIKIYASRSGGNIQVNMECPHNFDYSSQETINIDYAIGNAQSQELQLNENGINASYFNANISTSTEDIELSYGYGYFKKSLIIDSDLPMAPLNLGASLDDSQVLLNWIVNDDLATSYVLEKSVNGAAYIQLASVSQNTFTDTNVNENATIKYRLKAVNTNGSSSWSNVVSVSTLNSLSAEKFDYERGLLFPNPVKEGYLYVNKLERDDDIEIYNALGRKMNFNRTGNKILVDNYPIGIYFLFTKESNKVSKFIVSK